MTQLILATDRPDYEATWRTLRPEVRVVHPSDLSAQIASGAVVVIDGGCASVDEEDMLLMTGLSKALGATAAVQLPANGSMSEIDDLLSEMTSGLVARSDRDASWLSSAITRRTDSAQATRFEYVTVSPRDAALLLVLGDGRSSVVSRPVTPEDDGSDVSAIELLDGASRATITLESGSKFSLSANQVERPSVDLGQGVIEASKLGGRLRQLRLEAGLTQAELARRTGIHRPNIARVEAGRHTPSLETLTRIADAIGVSTLRVLAAE